MPLLELLGYPITFWSVTIALIVGHMFSDHVFQNEQMSLGKDHRQMTAYGHPYGQMWPIFLTSHAIVNGAVVGIITGSIMLGVAEMIVHWVIDYAKNERHDFGFITDQALHLICKAIWAAMLVNPMFTLP